MQLIELRNFLYRRKARVLFGSGPVSRLRRRMWRRAGPGDGVALIHSREQECFPPDDLARFEASRMQPFLAAENARWRMGTDTVHAITGPILLEPDNSLGVSRSGLFFEETKCNAHAHMQPSPSTRWRVLSARPALSLDEAVFFDGYASRNLYHFFNDALNDLAMMLDLGIVGPGTPLIVHRQVHDTRWFRWVRERAPFSGLNWVVQEPDQWIECGRLIVGAACHNWWRRCRELLARPYDGAPSGTRLYIDRSIRHARSIGNREPLYALLDRHRVKPVMLEELPFGEQVALFAGAELVVGLHGAGLTHMIWADPARLAAIELFPGDYLMPHYYWLARTFGIRRYDNLIGGPLDVRHQFEVDLGRLDRLLAEAG